MFSFPVRRKEAMKVDGIFPKNLNYMLASSHISGLNKLMIDGGCCKSIFNGLRHEGLSKRAIFP